MNDVVEILLATYQGERFLREQIDSILAQTYTPLQILARDDGSRDGTGAILDEYMHGFPDRFRIITGAPTGSAKGNFVRLMEASSAEYIAFADQDDVWLPEKIELEMRAMRKLEAKFGATIPLLVFSDLRVVDDKLKVLQPSFWANQGIDADNIARLPRLLAQNVVTGCTVLMNRRLVELGRRMPEDAYMHDWWLALTACAMGKATCLAEPTVLYRQHESNVLGARQGPRVSGVPKWRYHTKRREQWEISERLARGLLRVYAGELTKKQRAVVEAFVRCGTHRNRLVRVATWLRHGYFLSAALRPNLAIAWYLWDMAAAKDLAAEDAAARHIG